MTGRYWIVRDEIVWTELNTELCGCCCPMSVLPRVNPVKSLISKFPGVAGSRKIMFELSWWCMDPSGVWLVINDLYYTRTPPHHRTPNKHSTFRLNRLCQSDWKGNAVEEIVINEEKREARGKSRGYFYFL